MKTIFMAILFLFISVNAQEKYYTFSELRGMEDQSGNTHLFYRLFYEWEEELSSGRSNSIYHLDLNSNIDTLFLIDYGEYYQFMGPRFQRISDLEFWNDNPSENIYCGAEGSDDGFGFIQRFDMESGIYLPSFNVYNIEISRQNDSLLYAGGFNWFKSIDGGRNWEEYLTNNIQFVSLSPFNDEIMFASDGSSLYKSTNSGMNFSKVDTSDYSEVKFYYDKDSNHIYGTSSNMLRVSNNKGDAFSWSVQYEGSSDIHASIDYSQSGSIYLADGKHIYHSVDYGLSFSEYKVLDKKIVGIYKKPNSEKLYAATKYNLYEITSDSILIIKRLEPDPSLADFYPLAVGNKWVYESTSCSIDFPPEPCNISLNRVEVTGDTVLENGFEYFIIEGYLGKNFERYNQEDGTVRRYTEDTSFQNNEYVIEDLKAELGDTLCTNRFYKGYYDCEIINIFLGNSEGYLFNSLFKKKNYEITSLVGWSYSLAKGIGIDSVSSSFDFGYRIDLLKGCFINGVLFGDTTTVGVNDKKENIPAEFSLSKNYPNPFNPATTIRYSIPNWDLVTLKVFDLLGREIVTLVNEEKPAGEYEIEFNGGSLSSGIYFYQLKAGNSILTKKMIYLK